MADRTVVKRVKNAVQYSDGTVRIDNAIASYPHLDKPYKGDDGDTPRYSLVGLLPKTTHKEAKDLLKGMILDVLKASNKGKPIATDKWFLRDGDLTGKPENEGMFTVNSAETKRRPTAKGRNKETLEKDEVAAVIYGGCKVNMLIRPWWQDNKFGKRVNANLIAVQFVEDGEPFGEGRIGEDEIEDTFDSLDEDGGGFDESDDDMGGL